MVKTGQALTEFDFHNPDGESLEIEEFDFADFRRRLSEAQFTKPHRPTFHQIMLVTGGAATTMVDFVRYACRPGTLIHVAPGQVQRLPYGPSDGPAPLQARMLLFKAHFPTPLPQLEPITGSPADLVALSVPGDERERVTDAWTDLAVEYRRAADTRDLSDSTLDLLRLLLSVLLLRVLRLSDPAGARATPREPFRQFQRELEQSYRDTRTVADYATRIGYSSKTLSRICQGASGRSAKQLINARVTLEARRLLAHTDLHIAGIADHLGFRDPTNFVKFFGREAGTTPGAFRRAQHQTVRTPGDPVT